MSRYQFVWWGWSWMKFGLSRSVGALATVYVWGLCLGPLEIRKWQARP